MNNKTTTTRTWMQGISKEGWLTAIAVILAAIIGVLKLPKCSSDKLTFITEECSTTYDTLYYKFSLANNYHKGSLQIQDIKFHTLLVKKEKEDFFEKRIDLGVVTVLPNQSEKNIEISQEPTSLFGNSNIGRIETDKPQSFLIKIPRVKNASRVYFAISCDFFDLAGNQKNINSGCFYKIIMSASKEISITKYKLNKSNIDKVQKENNASLNLKGIFI